MWVDMVLSIGVVIGWVGVVVRYLGCEWVWLIIWVGVVVEYLSVWVVVECLCVCVC